MKITIQSCTYCFVPCLLACAAASGPIDRELIDASTDAAVHDARQPPPWQPESCFEPDGSCWEETSEEGADALQALCAARDETAHPNPTSCRSYDPFATLGACEDPARHLVHIIYWYDDLEDGAQAMCAAGEIARPGTATPEDIAACRATIEALGPVPAPDCSPAPGPHAPRDFRTFVENCVDRLAWINQACGACVLAQANWQVGAFDSPVIMCTGLHLGDPRYECADACTES
jgi:hypothetical protein